MTAPRDPPQPEDTEAAALDPQEVLAGLEHLAADRAALAHWPDALRIRLFKACGLLAHPDRLERTRFNKARRRLGKRRRRETDEQLLARTGIRMQRLALVYPTPASDDEGGQAAPPESPGRLVEARCCYTCKADYDEVHHFYDALCPACAELNWSKRHATADLTGKVALLTGGRVKIGYQVGIKLLRAGARLVVTTRFPRDAARRYAEEPDFDAWGERLTVFGLDLRHTPSVEGLAAHLAEHTPRLDYIINNACQTVRRPPGFYAHLMPGEDAPLEALPEACRTLLEEHERLRAAGVLARIGPGGSEVPETDAASNAPTAPAELSSEVPATNASSEGSAPDGGPSSDAPVTSAAGQNTAPDTAAELPGVALSAALSQLALVEGDDDRSQALFPTGALDADQQQVDLRDRNSWRLPLADVPTVELLEVHLVNAVAPFVLNARLKPLMLRTPERDKHIVNVSAMEGQFYRSFKTDKHPHTNMAKASLNMMTRTSAPDYERDGIHMNSVDTGWITDEDPVHITLQKQEEHGFHPPLDHVDAAARICDPIFHGVNTGEHPWGQFLKDYRPTHW